MSEDTRKDEEMLGGEETRAGRLSKVEPIWGVRHVNRFRSRQVTWS
tara:strand:- start:245 stop:382 length:138 start_codon:yes stop_codon:yes gene_type:complete